MLQNSDKKASGVKQELRQLFEELERLRVGQPRRDKPVYLAEGHHLSAVMPQEADSRLPSRR